MLNCLDMFAGTGGFTLGFKNSGIQTIGAIECDRFACQTYHNNFPDIDLYESKVEDIEESEIRNKFKGVDIIAAGPPCQGFSVAGPSQYGKIDKRNHLIFQVIRYVEIIRPEICIFENVKGFLSGKLSQTQKAIDEYVRGIEKLGYTTRIYTLQTADFGVPQWRERVFIVGAKKTDRVPQKIKGYFGSKRRPWRTVWEALSDLPKVESGQGIEDIVPYDRKACNTYQRWLRKYSSGIANHVSMNHTQRLIERFKHIPIGGSLVDVPKEYGQRKRNCHKLDACMRYKLNNQRLDPNKISTAITASFQSNFVHPFLHRNLTAREGARLQSFPDRFIFCGPRTLMSKSLLEREGRMDEIGLSQYNQIGNAVPPLVAESIGKQILRNISR